MCNIMVDNLTFFPDLQSQPLNRAETLPIPRSGYIPGMQGPNSSGRQDDFFLKLLSYSLKSQSPFLPLPCLLFPFF